MFRVSSTATHPDLPVATPLFSQINALASLHMALRVGPNSQSVEGGNISAMIDGEGTYTVTQGTAGRRAQYVAGAINGYDAAQFDATDDLFLVSPTPNFQPAFTLVSIVRPRANLAVNERWFGNRTATGQETRCYFGAGAVASFGHGNTVVTAAANTINGWNLVVSAWDGVGVIKLRVNGGPVVTNASNGAFSTLGAVVGAGNNANLEAFGGRLKLLHMHTADLFATDAGFAAQALYRDLARQYAIPVA